MKLEQFKAGDYDPFIATEHTDKQAVIIRRRHALDDAHKARQIAVDKAFADEAAEIERIHAHFDAMLKQVAA